MILKNLLSDNDNIMELFVKKLLILDKRLEVRRLNMFRKGYRLRLMKHDNFWRVVKGTFGSFYLIKMRQKYYTYKDDD